MMRGQLARRRRMRRQLLVHGCICLCTMVFAILPNNNKQEQNQKEIRAMVMVPSEQYDTTEPCLSDKVVSYEPDATITDIGTEDKQEVFRYSKDWDVNDNYLLAKIVMAEAEGCDMETKTLIALCVLNRVWSDKFPDTIQDVIFQPNQFSPIDNGRWDRVEPNAECYEAVSTAMETEYDYSNGCLYFESCTNENNWHSRNLEYLYESDGIRFYK